MGNPWYYVLLCISMGKKNTTATEWYDVQQAADKLGVNPGTIRRWAQCQTLHGVKVGVRGDWRFTSEDLQQLVSRHTERPHLAGPADAHNQTGEPTHTVQFYDNEAYLLDSLTEYVHAGLLAGEACLIIATPVHITQLGSRLHDRGLDSASYAKHGLYKALDAQATLDAFMAGGMPDQAKFQAVIGSAIAETAGRAIPTRAYGEMVALLWEAGNLAAVIRLEELWNEFVSSYPVALLCGYSMATFDEAEHETAFTAIGHLHSRVMPSESVKCSDDPADQLRSIAALQQQAEALRHDIHARHDAVRDLEAQALTLRAEQERLQQLNTAKDEFISIASHQLRTPATGVKQYLGMVLEGYFGELNPDQHRFITKAYESNERQIKVVNDLLLTAKVDAGKIHLSQQVHDLAQLIRDVAEEQKSEIENRQQTIGLELPDTLHGHFDPQYFRMAIENLISNASKYSPDGKRITVIAHSSAGQLRVSVQDEGIGISRKQQQKLYQKFSRIYNDQSVAEGNGLGLYWTKKIIELHDGRLMLHSQPGMGSTFTITIPQNLPDSAAGDPPVIG